MLDMTRVEAGEWTLADLFEPLTLADCQAQTEEMVAWLEAALVDCTDADVVFVPVDPEANDKFAANEDDQELAWTLGHLIVHVTASMEEAAALAAEFARGVAYHGRSRSEVAWETVKTVAQCRARLAESRRMCLASLQMWPDEPHLDYQPSNGSSGMEVNAIGRYFYGLTHAQSHMAQVESVVAQARAARLGS